MRRYEVRLGLEVEADLTRIRDYLRDVQSEMFAKRFVARILAHFSTFRTVPHRGTQLDDIRPGLRTVSWKRTVTIAFRVSDEKSRVEIVGVFYRGRDVAAALSKRLTD